MAENLPHVQPLPSKYNISSHSNRPTRWNKLPFRKYIYASDGIYTYTHIYIYTYKVNNKKKSLKKKKKLEAACFRPHARTRHIVNQEVGEKFFRYSNISKRDVEALTKTAIQVMEFSKNRLFSLEGGKQDNNTETEKPNKKIKCWFDLRLLDYVPIE